MLKICTENKSYVLDKIKNGKLDKAHISTSNLVDDIILSMYEHNIFDDIINTIPDHRAHNTTVPFDIVWALSIAAKMKTKTSLTDIPYAITDHRVLSKLGYTLIDSNDNLEKGIMNEGSLRFLINKYDELDFFKYYSRIVQEKITKRMNISPNIHILDCTKISVNIDNENYEGSSIGVDKDGNKCRGYKLSTLRGLVGDTGIIEDIRFSDIRTSDIELSKDMIMNSPSLKNGDILIEDRGFIDRELINYLKTNRGIDVYIPLRKNMTATDMAISIAKSENNWNPHPNKNRKNQYISFVDELGDFWESSNKDEDVPFNACVVWDKSFDGYFVFITTDLKKNAKQIVTTYEIRPEIEEDYRQLKEFWKLEDFKSTKLKLISFHITCVLFGYLFFQLYTLTPDGEKYTGKTLPVVLNKYVPQNNSAIVLYVNDKFGIFSLLEFSKLYGTLNEAIIPSIDAIVSLV